MKTRKALLASATAIALAAAMVPAVALAADDGHQTTVNYTVDERYTWTVPADVTFDTNALTDSKTAGDVSVSDNVIPASKSTQITLDPSNSFTIASGAATRSFTVGKDDSTTLKAGDPVLTVASGTASDKQALTFKLLAPAGALQAGTYKGTVTYTAGLV